VKLLRYYLRCRDDLIFGEIEHFTESSIVLKDGAQFRCDVCVLATGFNLDILKFEMYVGHERIDAAGTNDLPAIDNIVSYRFTAHKFNFS
jgi:cation diffusion facilitator CzcD-associated flavoprotein CzcO